MIVVTAEMFSNSQINCIHCIKCILYICNVFKPPQMNSLYLVYKNTIFLKTGVVETTFVLQPLKASVSYSNCYSPSQVIIAK